MNLFAFKCWLIKQTICKILGHKLHLKFPMEKKTIFGIEIIVAHNSCLRCWANFHAMETEYAPWTGSLPVEYEKFLNYVQSRYST